MFDTICNLPLSSEVFTQAIHPRYPLLSVGLSTGHVETFRLPNIASDPDECESETARPSAGSSSGFGRIETAWRTRRHKGSCRSLVFSSDGDIVFSAGTDGLVKAAKAETGVVEAKIAIPKDLPRTANEDDFPSLVHALTPQTLLLATDSGALHIYDLRDSDASSSTTYISSKPQQTHHPHEDFVTSITPLPPSAVSTSRQPKQWLSTGGTTLAITDIRRGVLVQSESQDTELLTSAFVGGFAHKGTSVGEKAVVGSAGTLSLWERGVWDDLDERIILDRDGAGVEALVNVPDHLEVGRGGKILVAGLDNGVIKGIQLGINKVAAEMRHHEIDGVVALGFDVAGRMISAGGETIKVWHENIDDDQESLHHESGDQAKKAASSDGDSEESSDSNDLNSRRKRTRWSRGTSKSRARNTGVMHIKGLD
ncbi:hypothetical protein BDY21DRAFT_291679 [Lineolata rhizophorae]|uniref:WD repeat-containing protein JIP5 n=1 Tax=Lineolata rhizophorae TaxID=578093 RepID=A0A6A6NRF7_9PEZI|nr:hypothetical protein BDY21DRAFT_291679 [Lineolata rhizophorae]